MNPAPAPPQTEKNEAGASALLPQDRSVLALIDGSNIRLRSALCTLARHGVAVRRDEPDRARLLLDTLGGWPPYKGGQFLFDLLEWEDFLLDGDPPPVIPTQDIINALDLPLRLLSAATAPAPPRPGALPMQRTAAAFDLPLRLFTVTAKTALDGLIGDLGSLAQLLTADRPSPRAESAAETIAVDGPDVTEYDGGDDDAEEKLPPLEAGFHLYPNVVLGAVAIAGPLLAVMR